EWAAFAARLGRPQMLYIYEPEPALLRMALDICDLSTPLQTKRIIPFTGTPQEAAEELATFLRENPGCEPPTVLHPLASLIGDRRNTLLAAGEAIVRHVVTQRQALVATLYTQLTTTLAAQTKPGTTVALLLTPRFPHERPLHDEARRRAA